MTCSARQTSALALLLAAMPIVQGAFATGCQTTTKVSQSRTRYSGFLGDYTDLKPATDWLRAFVEPDLDLAAYHSVIVDVPEVWLTDKTKEHVNHDNIEMAVSFYQAALKSKLGENWTVVTEAQQGTLRVRTALTDLSPAHGGRSAVTNIIPAIKLIDKLQALGTGRYLSAGEIGMEIEVADGMSGERFIAAVDERAGTDALPNVGSTWGDVKDAMDFWAARLTTQLLKHGMPAGSEGSKQN